MDKKFLNIPYFFYKSLNIPYFFYKCSEPIFKKCLLRQSKFQSIVKSVCETPSRENQKMMIWFNTFLAAPPFSSINRKYLASMFHYPWIQLGMLHFQEWSSGDRNKIWYKIFARNNTLPWNCACLKTKSFCKSHRIRSRQNFVSNVEKLTFSMVQNKVFLARCLFFLFIVVWPSACNRHFDLFHFKILKHC